MAPRWARATRPMVLVLTTTAFVVTWLFDADAGRPGRGLRDRRPGAHHLGLGGRDPGRPPGRRAREDHSFGVFAAIFTDTTVVNVVERPDGLKIGALFIAAIIAVSFASRLSRSFELRVTDVTFDDTAQLFLRDCSCRTLRLIANEPGPRDVEEYRTKLVQTTNNPLANLARFLLFGAGEVAPVSREVLREAEPDPTRRPHVHVG